MKKTLEIKLMIIENFIDHFTTDELVRQSMKTTAEQYVKEDHVDEIEQGMVENIKNQLKGIDEADLTKAEKKIKEIIQ